MFLCNLVCFLGLVSLVKKCGGPFLKELNLLGLLAHYTANVLTIKTTGLEIAGDLQGKSALSRAGSCSLFSNAHQF